jgi:hypothetical protein
MEVNPGSSQDNSGLPIEVMLQQPPLASLSSCTSIQQIQAAQLQKFDDWILGLIESGNLRHITKHTSDALIEAVLIALLPLVEQVFTPKNLFLKESQTSEAPQYNLEENPLVKFYLGQKLPPSQKADVLIGAFTERLKSPLGIELSRLIKQEKKSGKEWASKNVGRTQTREGGLTKKANDLRLAFDTYSPGQGVPVKPAEEALISFLGEIDPKLLPERLNLALLFKEFSNISMFYRIPNHGSENWAFFLCQKNSQSLTRMLTLHRSLFKAALRAGLNLSDLSDAKIFTWLVLLSGVNNGRDQVTAILQNCHTNLKAKIQIPSSVLPNLTPKDALEKFVPFLQLYRVLGVIEKLSSIAKDLEPTEGFEPAATMAGLFFKGAKLKELQRDKKKGLVAGLWGSLCSDLKEEAYQSIQNRAEAIAIFFPDLHPIPFLDREVRRDKFESLTLDEKACILALLLDVEKFNLSLLLSPLSNPESLLAIEKSINSIASQITNSQASRALIQRARCQIKEYLNLATITERENQLLETIELIKTNDNCTYRLCQLDHICRATHIVQKQFQFKFYKKIVGPKGDIFEHVSSDRALKIPIEELYVGVLNTDITGREVAGYVSAKRATDILTGDAWFKVENKTSFLSYVKENGGGPFIQKLYAHRERLLELARCLYKRKNTSSSQILAEIEIHPGIYVIENYGTAREITYDETIRFPLRQLHLEVTLLKGHNRERRYVSYKYLLSLLEDPLNPFILSKNSN